jgi:hypothetical protein
VPGARVHRAGNLSPTDEDDSLDCSVKVAGNAGRVSFVGTGMQATKTNSKKYIKIDKLGYNFHNLILYYT